MKIIIPILSVFLLLSSCMPKNGNNKNANTSSNITDSSSISTPSSSNNSSNTVISSDDLIKRNNWDAVKYNSLDELISQKDLKNIRSYKGIDIVLKNNQIIYTDLKSGIKLILPPLKLQYYIEEEISTNPPQKMDYRKLHLNYPSISSSMQNKITICTYRISWNPIQKAIQDNINSKTPWNNCNLNSDLQINNDKGFGGIRKYLEACYDDKYLFIYEIEGWNTFFQAEMAKYTYQNGGKDFLLFLVKNMYSIERETALQ